MIGLTLIYAPWLRSTVFASRQNARVVDSSAAHRNKNGRGAIGVFCEAHFNGTCLIKAVTKDGPAEHAGLRPGDVLLRLDPADYSSTALAQIAKSPIGTQITVPFERKGEHKQVTITVQDQMAIALRGDALGDDSDENDIGDIYANALVVPHEDSEE